MGARGAPAPACKRRIAQGTASPILEHDLVEGGDVTPDLADVLACVRSDAAVLRRHSDARLADALEDLCAEVEAAATDWLTWLSETEALARSAKSTDFFRARRGQWLIDGLARKERPALSLQARHRAAQPVVGDSAGGSGDGAAGMTPVRPACR